MRFATKTNGLVEIDAGYDGSDFTVNVAVSFDGFSAKTGTWLPVSAWRDFVAQLIALEASRVGTATLTSSELLLTMRSTQRSGEMSIEGFLAAYDPLPPARLTFAARAFDSADFPRIVRELRTITSTA